MQNPDLTIAPLTMLSHTHKESAEKAAGLWNTGTFRISPCSEDGDGLPCTGKKGYLEANSNSSSRRAARIYLAESLQLCQRMEVTVWESSSCDVKVLEKLWREWIECQFSVVLSKT